jgi:hypothetical protein
MKLESQVLEVVGPGAARIGSVSHACKTN